MSKKRSKKKMGRPSVYDTRIEPHLKMIHDLRVQGHTHEDIISMLGISKTAYYKHRREIEDFTHTLKNADAALIEKLEKSMYDLALGKAQEVVEVEKEVYTQDGRQLLKEKRVKKLPPHPTSLFFVLTNLKADKWRHKQDVVVEMYDDEVDNLEDVMLRSFKGDD